MRLQRSRGGIPCSSQRCPHDNPNFNVSHNSNAIASHIMHIIVQHTISLYNRKVLFVRDVFVYSCQVGFSWFQVGFHGFSWFQVGCSWIQVSFYRSRLIFLGFRSVFMVFHSSRLVFHGFSWFRVGFHGFSMVSGWFFMVLGGFSWFFMVPGWFFMVFHVSRLVFHIFS